MKPGEVFQLVFFLGPGRRARRPSSADGWPRSSAASGSFSPRSWAGWSEVIYRVARVDPAEEMTWQRYAAAVLAFNFLGLVHAPRACRPGQAWLPLNPAGQANVEFGLALNTAISFVTNTNWQAYSGENTMSYLTQMLGLSVQNFFSAATGIVVLLALVRGLTRARFTTIGNFWADLVRSTVYILLPLSFVLALVLVSQGVVQTFSGYPTVTTLEGAHPGRAARAGSLADRDQATGHQWRRLLRRQQRAPFREPDAALQFSGAAGDHPDPRGDRLHLRRSRRQSPARLQHLRRDDGRRAGGPGGGALGRISSRIPRKAG